MGPRIREDKGGFMPFPAFPRLGIGGLLGMGMRWGGRRRGRIGRDTATRFFDSAALRSEPVKKYPQGASLSTFLKLN